MANRHGDLMKQGIWKEIKFKDPRPVDVVTCFLCENWHARNKHTAPPAVMTANKSRYKAPYQRSVIPSK